MTIRKIHIYFLLISLSGILNFGCNHHPELGAQIQPQEKKGFALIEMFTSEGCSSCPPAYTVAGNLQTEAAKYGWDLFVMDFHVDYWNFMGWIDPYSKSEFTGRQKNYIKALNVEDLYTPQMVLNGKSQFIGSQDEKVRNELDKAFSLDKKIFLKTKTISSDESGITMEYQLSSIPDQGVLNLALTEDEVSSNVTSGENAGKVLVHHNVVQKIETFPINGRKGRISLSKLDIKSGGHYKVVTYVQDEKSLEIYGFDIKALPKITTTVQKDKGNQN